MRYAVWIAIWLTSAAWAQDGTKKNPDRYNGNYYGYGAFGVCQHGYGIFGAGAGAEGLVWKGVSVGMEGSYHSFTDGWGFGFITVQTGYHFVRRNGPLRWDPFVTYGIGAALGKEGGAGWSSNLGGGATYWFRPRLGLRFEGRVIGMAGEAVMTGRIGVSFR